MIRLPFYSEEDCQRGLNEILVKGNRSSEVARASRGDDTDWEQFGRHQLTPRGKQVVFPSLREPLALPKTRSTKNTFKTRFSKGKFERSAVTVIPSSQEKRQSLERLSRFITGHGADATCSFSVSYPIALFFSLKFLNSHPAPINYPPLIIPAVSNFFTWEKKSRDGMVRPPQPRWAKRLADSRLS